MRFRNTKTGVIIDVPSELKGPWKPVDGGEKATSTASEPVTEEVKPAKRTRKTKKEEGK